ncbi:unnamed protein product [Oppiella nova]|uniref:Uncharacterized protein n=1 Tax=Oppiella nova TaxID=334625 RepID=A0A7R9QU57_9ACAR|nr:unnamed protein product [Oppiella nova]CAG2174497.1 unnamed protein product [Oppiella nova]
MQLTKVNYWNKWLKNGRRPARPVTRFKADKPMVLRNEVTSGTKIASDVELNNDDVIPTPGQQKLSKDQMNVLLQRWPQPK